MPRNSEKKSEQVAIKLSPVLFEVLSRIRDKEDRPLGYVARELMLRGLTLYLRDGSLRDPNPIRLEHAIRRIITDDVIELDVAFSQIDRLEQDPSLKVVGVRSQGELTDEFQSSKNHSRTTPRKRRTKKAAR